VILTHKFPAAASDILESLGVDGMSSEDSDGDIRGTQRVFHVKALPWRHQDLTRWLHYLDKFPRNPIGSIGMRSYSKLTRQRVMDQNTLSARQPPRGLSEAFFDPSWLAAQPPFTHQRLNISSGQSKLTLIHQTGVL
jgi:hypothetical protein